jgi:hypothetical protein
MFLPKFDLDLLIISELNVKNVLIYQPLRGAFPCFTTGRFFWQTLKKFLPEMIQID